MMTDDKLLIEIIVESCTIKRIKKNAGRISEMHVDVCEYKAIACAPATQFNEKCSYYRLRMLDESS